MSDWKKEEEDIWQAELREWGGDFNGMYHHDSNEWVRDNKWRRDAWVKKNNTADLQASNTEKRDSKVSKGAETKADDGEFGQSEESAENEDDMKKASSGKRGKAAGKMLGFK